ncbi:CAF1 family ribonuclease-domain-containing protein [Coniochaeta sp. 2T2.1]|nr:CAF1 family ribonuclease-domain-containing protein [Coniochaeta sp. 2T2.1]
MQISSKNYWESLPVVLEAIAVADYIAFDLEMTGVQTKTVTVPDQKALAFAYHIAKEAAERFQIVQFGITCITNYPSSTKDFRASTFNFLLNPSFIGDRPVDKRLAKVLDRYVGWSQSSVMFLRDNGFEVARAFQDGVPYLSQGEVRELMEGSFLNPSGQGRPEHRLNLAEYDIEATYFQNYARQSIREWYTSRPPQSSHVNIRNTHGGRVNALQIRIVAELVKDEYPNCKAFPKAGGEYVQVRLKEKDEDDRIAAEREDAVCRHKGFLFVIEALVGWLSVDMLPIEYLVPSPTPDRPAALTAMKEKLEGLQDKLIRRQRIVIGHNSFYDLCFLYRSFFGPMPKTIDQFGIEIKFLFPQFVDTKYLGRRPGNDCMLPDDNLKELFQKARQRSMLNTPPYPGMSHAVQIPGQYAVAANDAGYDSWMTAVVFLKCAWERAEAEARNRAAMQSDKSQQSKIDAYAKDLAQNVSSMRLSFVDDTWKKHLPFEITARQTMYNPTSSEAGVAPLFSTRPVPPMRPDGTMNPTTSWLRTPTAEEEPTRPGTSSTAKTVGTSLLDMTEEEAAKVSGFPPLIPDGTLSPLPTVSECMRQAILRDGLTSDCVESSQYTIIVEKLPGWKDEMWRRFGNKIKVGTGILDLDQFEIEREK